MVNRSSSASVVEILAIIVLTASLSIPVTSYAQKEPARPYIVEFCAAILSTVAPASEPAAPYLDAMQSYQAVTDFDEEVFAEYLEALATKINSGPVYFGLAYMQTAAEECMAVIDSKYTEEDASQ